MVAIELSGSILDFEEIRESTYESPSVGTSIQPEVREPVEIQVTNESQTPTETKEFPLALRKGCRNSQRLEFYGFHINQTPDLYGFNISTKVKH